MSEFIPRQNFDTRRKSGKEQVYVSPDKLLEKAYAYFEWCDYNPCVRQDLMKSGDRKGEIVDIPIGRPYTLAGLCVYCGISQPTLDRYASDPRFEAAVVHIRYVIEQDQIEGAIVGMYNAGVVSRLLGLSDKDASPTSNKPLVIQVTVMDTHKDIAVLRSNLSEDLQEKEGAVY